MLLFSSCIKVRNKVIGLGSESLLIIEKPDRFIQI